MKGEMYYRESWPKELRIQIENEDELKFLSVLFNFTPQTTIAKFKDIAFGTAWKKEFIKKCKARIPGTGTAYSTHEVSEAIETELWDISMDETYGSEVSEDNPPLPF